MPRRSHVLVTALGLILGCRDDPAGVEQPPTDPTAPLALDLTPVHDRLAHPLVHELVGGLSEQASARTFQDLIDALTTPPTQSQLDQIHWTFSQVLDALGPGDANDEDEIPRAILKLIVEEAMVVLDNAEQGKGT